jgi:hypothetical protein
MSHVRLAGTILVGLLLGGCAGGSGPGGANAQAPETTMVGRWMLSAPNAPSCGITFTGAATARAGNAAPEGGCPGKFFLSRRWTLDQDTLAINDEEGNALATFKRTDGRFEGQAAAGFAVTLSRPPAPPQQ